VFRAVALDESARILLRVLLVMRTTTMRGLGGAMLVVLGLAGAVACGDNPTPPDVPDPRTCTATWRTVYSPDDQTLRVPFDREQTTALHGGQLYFNASLSPVPERDGLWAIPTAGGPATQVYAGSLWAIWIEDDDLIFGQGPTLYRLPIGGGDPQPILTHHIFDAGLSSRLVESWGLDRDALYWILYDYVSVTVWRSPRDGSGDQQIAALPASEGSIGTASSVRLTLVGDQVFVTSDTDAWAVAKTGGELRTVLSKADINGHLIAMASDGGMLRWRIAGDSNHFRGELIRLTPDTSPGDALWSFDPRTTSIDQAWSDGAGGWYVAAEETATDAGRHLTIHSLAQGEPGPTRLACDPEINRVVFSGEGTSDGIFVLVGNTNAWEIAGVARQP
jgi:hypothetical protein